MLRFYKKTQSKSAVWDVPVGDEYENVPTGVPVPSVHNEEASRLSVHWIKCDKMPSGSLSRYSVITTL